MCFGLPLLSGCKQGSFLERRFTNFTAYYNTFYNAERSFIKGEKAVQRGNQPVNRDVYMSVYPLPESAARSADFENAIRKSADVLREHPNSRWVDDALLLIGKSYFYQQNFVGAEQKFRETIALGSPLQDEARLWLLRTLIAGRNHEPAIEVLTGSLEREDISPRWSPLIKLMGGELHVRRRNWNEAVRFLNDGLRDVRDRDAAARAQYLLGQVYETMGEYQLAAESFENVERFRPVYELSYAALYSHVRVLGLNGYHNDALRTVRRLTRDDKHFANRAELEMLRGKILAASGDARGALAVYDNLLLDPESGRGNLRGRIHYVMAELFRDSYQDFSLAAAHFDTAATSLRSPQDQQRVQYVPSAIVDAAETAQVFKNFAALSGRVAEMDSLLWLGSLDDATFDSLLVVYQERMTAEMLAARTEQARRDAEISFTNPGMRPDEDGGRPTFGEEATATQDSDHGFLFHKNPARVQEGYFHFARVWGDRPLIPNWRRTESIGAFQRVARLGADSPAGAGENGGTRAVATPGVPLLDASGVPRDSVAQATMRSERAAARYELANALFLNMNMPDSAAAWYRRVIREDWSHPVAQRANYALAELHRSLGDTESAERLYREIIDNYPETDFARRAREQLNLPPLEEVLKDDTLQIAERAYATHYEEWQRSEFAPAFTGMLRLADEHPESEIAPRAALAAALIYTDWARRDELDVYAVIQADTLRRSYFGTETSDDDHAGSPHGWLPDTLRVETLYASLESHFPGTPYAERARSLRTFLEEQRPQAEPEMDEDHAEESLALFEPAGAAGEGMLGAGQMQDTTVHESEVAFHEPLHEGTPGAEASDASDTSDASVHDSTVEYQESLPADDPGARGREDLSPPADSLQATIRADEPERMPAGVSPDETRAPVEPVVEDPAVYSPEDVVPERGGFTWIFTSGPNIDAVQREVARIKRLGYRAGVLSLEQDEGNMVYRGAVGQFTTRDAALEAKSHLDPIFESEIWLLRIR